MYLVSGLWNTFRRFARRRLLACVVLGILPIAVRVATRHYFPLPDPTVTDEYSYLLGADTFASGRVTNPRHPLWQHFETWQVISQPTYNSRYPPGQALFLAVGQKVFGHPLYGVWLSFGVMCACLCWMLQGWMPPVYAVLGTLAGMGQIGIFGYWMNSYWGGAIAAAGGCLVLGAIERLNIGAKLSAVVFGGLGAGLLAFSRPLEGGLVIAVGGALLLIRRRRRGRKLSELLVPAVIVPALVAGVLIAGAMTYYNYRVTGHPLLMPYMVYERTYAEAPFLIFMPARHLTYHHEPMRKYYAEASMSQYLRKRAQPWTNIFPVRGVLAFYISAIVCFGGLVGALFCRSARIRTAFAVLAAVSLIMVAEKTPHAHYFAPACGLIFAVSMTGIRFLSLKAGRLGPAVLVFFVGIVLTQNWIEALTAHYAIPNPHTLLARDLMKTGPQHLVIVRYDYTRRGNAPGFEYVYNKADIDRSAVVWARDMGDAKNRELVDYYHGRKIWLLEPHLTPTRLTAYTAAAGDTASVGKSLQ